MSQNSKSSDRTKSRYTDTSGTGASEPMPKTTKQPKIDHQRRKMIQSGNLVLTPAVGQMEKDTKWPKVIIPTLKAIKKGHKVAFLFVAMDTKWPF